MAFRNNNFLTILLTLTLSGCYYDVEEVLYPSTECNTSNVTYAQTIRPLLVDRCYKCHDQANNSGNVTLEGYDNVIRYVNNGQLLGTIKHQDGYAAMPKNESPLLDCQIAKIEKWIDEGALNN